MLTKLIVVGLLFFSDAQGQVTAVGDGFPPKFELIQALMIVLVSCKHKVDSLRNEGDRVLTTLLSL